MVATSGQRGLAARPGPWPGAVPDLAMCLCCSGAPSLAAPGAGVGDRPCAPGSTGRCAGHQDVGVGQALVGTGAKSAQHATAFRGRPGPPAARPGCAAARRQVHRVVMQPRLWAAMTTGPSIGKNLPCQCADPGVALGVSQSSAPCAARPEAICPLAFASVRAQSHASRER